MSKRRYRHVGDTFACYAACNASVGALRIIRPDPDDQKPVQNLSMISDTCSSWVSPVSFTGFALSKLVDMWLNLLNRQNFVADASTTNSRHSPTLTQFAESHEFLDKSETAIFSAILSENATNLSETTTKPQDTLFADSSWPNS